MSLGRFALTGIVRFGLKSCNWDLCASNGAFLPGREVPFMEWKFALNIHLFMCFEHVPGIFKVSPGFGTHCDEVVKTFPYFRTGESCACFVTKKTIVIMRLFP